MIRAFQHIFGMAEQSRDLKYEVSISYQQIYLDSITDLLNPSSSVEIREDPKSGVYVAGAQWDKASTAKEAIKVLQKGNSNRATACTKMNSASSRSHAALIVKVTTTGGVRTLNGMLYLVDLAGSERVKKSGVEGAAFDEAKAINQSLTTLGRCIEVLASNKKEKPPFRDSKLTRLLSNAIGGGAKTTLIICCAPTMTDQFETTGSLDFGQQAMNVVVRAKVNASTDFGSLTSSLLLQRDKKQKPIRQLEAKVLSELRPQLDEVVTLELDYKKAALAVETLQEGVERYKQQLGEVEKAAVAEADADKEVMVGLLNERSEAAHALEKVLVSLSTDPEMKRAQDEHEAEKAEAIKRSMSLQEELREAESREKFQRKALDAKMSGVVGTAHNLGQTAAYFLSTGEVEEAATFYMQAKQMFEGLLGADHPRTRQWQEDLFFLINAPAIQQMVRQTQHEQKDRRGAVVDTAAKAQPDEEDVEGAWWLRGLFEMGDTDDDAEVATGGETDEAKKSKEKQGLDGINWWMRDLFEHADIFAPFGSGVGAAADDEDLENPYAPLLSSRTRQPDGSTTPRGGAPTFTPRGTLVALLEVNGNKAAALSLGKPLQKQFGIPEEQQVNDATVNMDFAKEWISKVFETPREGAASRAGGGVDELKQEKYDAAQWLRENFGPQAGAGKRGAATAADDAENRVVN